MHRIALRIAALSLALTPTLAFAHPGHDGVSLCPWLRASAGRHSTTSPPWWRSACWRPSIGGRALWLVPASFVAAMTAGGRGRHGGPRPALSWRPGFCSPWWCLGAIVALRVTMPVAAAMGLVAFFAIFHGYAHGAEMPDAASGMAYGAGFVVATALLHALGVGLGLTIGARRFIRRAV